MPRWVAAKEYVPSLHLPVEPVGREDEVVAGLGDELPKLVETPAYRATLLYFCSSWTQFTLTLPKNVCTSCCITCRRFRCFYGESMGKYGQFYGQLSNQIASNTEA